MSEENEGLNEQQVEIIQSVKPTKDELMAARALLKRNAELIVRGDAFDLGSSSPPASGTVVPYQGGQPQELNVKRLNAHDLPNPADLEQADVESIVMGGMTMLAMRFAAPYARTKAAKTFVGAAAGGLAGLLIGELSERARGGNKRGKNLRRNRNQQERY